MNLDQKNEPEYAGYAGTSLLVVIDTGYAGEVRALQSIYSYNLDILVGSY